MSFKTLWVDKYSPQTVDDYVWENSEVKARFQNWIKDGAIDNLLFYGPQGTGKSSLAKVLMKEMGIDECDYLKINASREGNIDTIRERVIPFVHSGGFSGSYKYVILEEASGLSFAAQESLKEDTEAYQHVVRWIFTTNDLNKLSQALKDRFTTISFNHPDEDAFLDRIIYVLESEGVDYTYDPMVIDHIQNIVKKNYPSLRACIRALQYYTLDGKLGMTAPKHMGTHSWKETMVTLFKAKKIREARDLIATYALTSDYEELYRWVYENIEIFKNPDSALLILANGYRHHSHVADPEINFSATMTEIIINSG